MADTTDVHIGVTLLLSPVCYDLLLVKHVSGEVVAVNRGTRVNGTIEGINTRSLGLGAEDKFSSDMFATTVW